MRDLKDYNKRTKQLELEEIILDLGMKLIITIVFGLVVVIPFFA